MYCQKSLRMRMGKTPSATIDVIGEQIIQMPRRQNASSNRRKLIWKKTNGVCAHCGNKTGSQGQTVDHVIPQSLGGGNDLRNLMPLCKFCNKTRSTNKIQPEKFYKYAADWAIEEFRDYQIQWELERRDSYGTLIVEENKYGKMY